MVEGLETGLLPLALETSVAGSFDALNLDEEHGVGGLQDFDFSEHYYTAAPQMEDSEEDGTQGRGGPVHGDSDGAGTARPPSRARVGKAKCVAAGHMVATVAEDFVAKSPRMGGRARAGTAERGRRGGRGRRRQGAGECRALCKDHSIVRAHNLFPCMLYQLPRARGIPSIVRADHLANVSAQRRLHNSAARAAPRCCTHYACTARFGAACSAWRVHAVSLLSCARNTSPTLAHSGAYTAVPHVQRHGAARIMRAQTIWVWSAAPGARARRLFYRARETPREH